MLRSISPEQFREWQEYDAIDPIGAWRQDHQTGLIAWVCAKVGGAKTAKLSDFIPKFGRKKDRPKTGAEMARVLRNYTLAHNAYHAQEQARAKVNG